MIDSSTDPTLQLVDSWGTTRIWVAGIFGVAFAGSQMILDFWPIGFGGSLGVTLRAFFDLSRLPFLLLLAGFIVVLLIAAGIALWRRHFRRVMSSILAVVAIPICVAVVAWVPLFDP